jgi:hypothetical protein
VCSRGDVRWAHRFQMRLALGADSTKCMERNIE